MAATRRLRRVSPQPSEQTLEAALAWLSAQLPSAERDLAALVNLNSFTANPAGGNAVVAELLRLFDLPGVTARRVASQTFADHLVLTTRGAPGRAPVALLGHLDTVFPPGKFEGYRVDGALRRGPGVLDMKGGLVVIAQALAALSKHGGLDALAPLRIVIVSDEEVGSPEGQDVIRQAIAGARAALVFESGRAKDAIITRRKGTGAMEASAHGKAAHAGNAHARGSNAIWALARFIDRAQALTDYARGVTVNVGQVSGGQSKNTVPDHALAQVDLRFESEEDARRLMAALRQAAQESAASVAGTTLALSGGVARAPLQRTDESARLLEEYAACARACGLGTGESPLVGGGSDASTSSAMGIPSIDGLGPRGDGFHTVEEHIEVDTLIPKAQALARFLAIS